MYTDPRPQQEDQNLDTTLRPLNFNEYVGQGKVKKTMISDVSNINKREGDTSKAVSLSHLNSGLNKWDNDDNEGHPPNRWRISLIFSSVCFSTISIFSALAFLIFFARASRSAGFSKKSVAPTFMASTVFSTVA